MLNKYKIQQTNIVMENRYNEHVSHIRRKQHRIIPNESAVTHIRTQRTKYKFNW